MSDKDFLELRNALDLLSTRFGVKAVVMDNNHRDEIVKKIYESYGGSALMGLYPLVSGVQIVNT